MNHKSATAKKIDSESFTVGEADKIYVFWLNVHVAKSWYNINQNKNDPESFTKYP